MWRGENKERNANECPERKIGKDGYRVSLLGFDPRFCLWFCPSLLALSFSFSALIGEKCKQDKENTAVAVTAAAPCSRSHEIHRFRYIYAFVRVCVYGVGRLVNKLVGHMKAEQHYYTTLSK